MLEDLIEGFSSRNKNFKVLYGGDGTLVSGWRENRKKCLLPIRNYGLCGIHMPFYEKLLKNSLEHGVRQFLFPTISIHGNDKFASKDTEAISEIVLMNVDVTQCMRVNVYVNGHAANKDVICNGVIASTNLGSTGYFKSISRTIFRSGIGLAFILPTYSIPNIILDQTDDIKIEFCRKTTANVACDKLVYEEEFSKGETLNIGSTSENISIFGYDAFMCEECRRNRNSTIVNDSYIIG